MNVARPILLVPAAILCLLASAPTTFASPGELDPSFGSGGVVTTSIPGYSAVAGGVAVQPDGRIVVVGTAFNAAETFPFTSNWTGVLARYLPSGALDPSFGGTGIVMAPGRPLSYQGVFIQSDGKILVAGTVESTPFAIAVTRYLRNGQLDTTFGVMGTATLSNAPAGYRSAALAVQPDGKIVLSGWISDSDFNALGMLIVRLDASGGLDASFGQGGVQDVFAGTRGQAFGIALQPDGKILIGGQLGTSSGVVARINSDGSLDASFGSDGVASMPFAFTEIPAVAIRADGRVIAAGYRLIVNDGSDFLAAQFTPLGKLDMTFGIGGSATASALSSDFGISACLQPKGKVIIGGYSDVAPATDVAVVVRFNAGGTIDASFANGGIAKLPALGSADVFAIACQADKVIVVGFSQGAGATTPSVLLVARYDASDRVLDPVPAFSSTALVLLASSLATLGLVALFRHRQRR